MDTRNSIPCSVQIDDMDLAVGILCQETFGQMRANEPTSTGNDNSTEVRRGGLARHGDKVETACAELPQGVLSNWCACSLADKFAQEFEG